MTTSRSSLLSIEISLLFVITLAFLRSSNFVAYGIDPHHDYYSIASGVDFIYGLKPNLQSFTQYGPFDAIAKAILLKLSGFKLVNLRIITYALDILGLLIVCYSTNLSRAYRCLLLAFICLWLAIDPSAFGNWTTLYWHKLSWSSDIAIFLICLLICVQYRNLRWKFFQVGPEELNPKPLNSAVAFSYFSINKKRFNASPVFIYQFISGFLISLLILTKFTIGLPAAIAISFIEILSLGFISYLSKFEKSFVNLIQIFHSGFSYLLSISISKPQLLINGYFLGVSLTIATFILFLGGISGIFSYISQVFGSNLNHFIGTTPEDSHLILLSKLFWGIVQAYLFNQYFFLSGFSIFIIIVLHEVFNLSKIWISWIILVIVCIVVRILGMNSLPYLGYLVEASFLYLLVPLIFKKRNWLRSDISELAITLSFLPLSISSLSQFYPIADNFHIWWALGSALPGFSFLLFGQLYTTKTVEHYRIALTSFAMASFYIICFTYLKLTAERNQLVFHELPIRSIPLLDGIKTVDKNFVYTIKALDGLQQVQKNVILIESSMASFFELTNSRDAARARSKCIVLPLSLLKANEKVALLSCLRNLKKQGWVPIFTNFQNINALPLLPNSFFWASVSQGYAPQIVLDNKPSFSEETFKGVRFWRLKN